MACSAVCSNEFWEYRQQRLQKELDIPGSKRGTMDILLKLRADGMSSDECHAATGVVMYARRTHKWRSAMLQGFLNQVRQWLKMNGNITLTYTESEVSSRRPAPTGLPRRFYHDELLQTLTPQQRRDLRMTR